MKNILTISLILMCIINTKGATNLNNNINNKINYIQLSDTIPDSTNLLKFLYPNMDFGKTKGGGYVDTNSVSYRKLIQLEDSLFQIVSQYDDSTAIQYLTSKIYQKQTVENSGDATPGYSIIYKIAKRNPYAILKVLSTTDMSNDKKATLISAVRGAIGYPSDSVNIDSQYVLDVLLVNFDKIDLVYQNYNIHHEYVLLINSINKQIAMDKLMNTYNTSSDNSFREQLIFDFIFWRNLNYWRSNFISSQIDSFFIESNININDLINSNADIEKRWQDSTKIVVVDTSFTTSTNDSIENNLTIFDLYPNHPELIVFLDTTLDLHGVLHHGDDGRQFGDYTTSELLQIIDSINITTAYPSDQLMGYTKASIYIRKITQIIGDRLVNNELNLSGLDQIPLDGAIDDLINVVQNSWTMDTVFASTDTLLFHNPNSVSREAQGQLLRLWTIVKDRYVALLESDDEILKNMAQHHLAIIANEAIIIELIQFAVDNPRRKVKYRVINVLKKIKHVAHPQGAIGNKPFRRPMYSHAQAQDWKERLIDPGINQIKAR